MDPVERGSVTMLVAVNKDARCVRAMSDNSLAAARLASQRRADSGPLDYKAFVMAHYR